MRTRCYFFGSILTLSAGISACTGDDVPATSASTETSATGDGDGDGTSGDGDGEPATGDGGGEGEGGTSIDCAAAGYDVKAFDGSATTHEFDALVPDFSVETLRGAYTLSEHWSGCENHVLIPATPTFASQPIEGLIDDGEPNTIYLIYSMNADDATAASEVGAFANTIEAYLESLGPEAYEAWTWRFRYVNQSGQSVPLFSYVHSMNTGADFFAIDQYQQLRNGGSGAVAQNNGTWVEQLGHARYAAKFYNYEAMLQQRHAEEAAELGDGLVPVTVLESSWAAETTTNSEGLDGVVTVEFPSAEVMARFDRAEIVVKEDCGHFPGDALSCSGERGILIGLCVGHPECEFGDSGATHEVFFKIISGYATGGWWTQDVSHILPALRGGGSIPMRVNWVGKEESDLQANVQIRLYDLSEDTSEDARATLHLPLFGSSPFNAAYAERMPHYRFTPPPGTTKVTLHTHATGHGGGGNGTCAEFCTLGQHIHVNDTTYDFEWEQKNSWDCAARVNLGVTPNQWGTWYFDRSNWCPGWTAETYDVDITEAVDLDGPNLIAWSGSYGSDWPEKGSLHNKPWLVFHGPEDTGPATLEIAAKPSCANVEVTVRDFSQSFADFEPVFAAYDALANDDPEHEAANGVLTGVVEPTLVDTGLGPKPVLAWPEGALPYTGAATFAQWFTDVPGVNETLSDAALVHQTREGTAMVMVYPSHTAPALPDAFGFGIEDEEATVNVGYTLEAEATFTYAPGQRIRLGSEDDMWVFIDGQLVFERGGPFHGSGSEILEFDGLGLVEGAEYPIHVFLADRGRGLNPHHWFEIPTCEPQP